MISPSAFGPRRHRGHVHHDPAREHHHEGEPPIYDRGLRFDVDTALDRRRALGLLAGAAALPLLVAAAPATAAAGLACTATPEEIVGPFPSDGSNGPNVLDDMGIVRSNIRSSFGGLSGFASGVQLTIQLRLLNSARGCGPWAGAALYVWHCDRLGRYSMYADGVRNQNYLRGVQPTNANGQLRFVSTFPGCYPGRWPHLHVEVYPSLAEATTFRNKIATTQIALGARACRTVYASPGYEASREVFGDTSLEDDISFNDGYDEQLAVTQGNVATGYTARLAIAV